MGGKCVCGACRGGYHLKKIAAVSYRKGNVFKSEAAYLICSCGLGSSVFNNGSAVYDDRSVLDYAVKEQLVICRNVQ